MLQRPTRSEKMCISLLTLTVVVQSIQAATQLNTRYMNICMQSTTDCQVIKTKLVQFLPGVNEAQLSYVLNEGHLVTSIPVVNFCWINVAPMLVPTLYNGYVMVRSVNSFNG